MSNLLTSLTISILASNVVAPDINLVGQLLGQIGITWVAPPPRPGTCRDCTRSDERFRIGRFGFDVVPTQATGQPCCSVVATTPATPTPTTAVTTSGCKCGTEGQTRIVGGVLSAVSFEIELESNLYFGIKTCYL